MTLRLRRLLGVAGALAALSVSAYLSAPSLARWHINKRPDVKVGRVELVNFQTAILHDVQVTRPDAVGVFTLATISLKNHHIDIDGGVLDLLDAKKAASTGGSEGYSVFATNLQVHVTRGETNATLRGATVTAEQVCFDSASFVDPRVSGSLTSGCVTRDGSRADFKSAELTPNLGELKLTLPLVIQDGKVQRLGHDGTFTAETITNGDRSAQHVRLVKDGLKVKVEMESASFNYDRVSPDPFTVRKVKAWVSDYTKVREEVVEAEVNGIPIHVDTSLRRVWASASCQEWLDSLPNELLEGPLQELKLKGDLSFDVALRPEVNFTLKNTCKTDGVPAFIKVLRSEFQYVAYDDKKNEVIRVSGPASKDWVPLQDVSPNMRLSLTTTEDPAFFGHRGFIPQAIENSLRDNLRAGRFIRGGSTLTMQLAKNIWLRRSKTLGRKVQEAFLTMALESNLSKEEIFALYLNVVEFGPNIYGIGEAATQLLGTEPSKLTLTEAIYLAQRLPHPVTAGPLNEAQRPAIKRVLDNMVQGGKITQEIATTEEHAVYFDTTTANLMVNE